MNIPSFAMRLAWNLKTGAVAVSLKNSIEFLIHRGADK